MTEAVCYSGADLLFTAAPHEYRLPDGRHVPSVTQILKAVGVSVDFDALAGMSARHGDAIEQARALGTAVHADAHAYDDNDLEWSTVHPDVLPYLYAWATCRENLGLVPLQRERRLYSPTLGVCGTLDAVCCRPARVEHLILIDVKCGDPESAGAQFQTAGYALLWDEEHPDQPIGERWSVELTPGTTIPYRVHPYTDWNDRAAFRAFVTTFYHQAARRGRT